MRVVQTWSDKVPERDGVKSVCYDVAFKPDGTQLVAAVGSRVLMYDALDGDLLHSLKGHKDAVYCVAYSRDGKRFASGGADKTIIIWTHKAEGILKYSHNDSIQCLAYNPLTQQLASATATDFGLWAPEQKSVAKHKMPAKALCCAWTLDGLHLALGLYNGTITIRDGRAGTEVVSIQRTAPVWALAWCPPSKEESAEQLAVGCWDSTLSFYRLNGQQVGKDRILESDPTTLAFMGPNSEFLLIGGTDRKVQLATRDGTFLCQLAERDDWVWCARARPRGTHFAAACQDGSVAVYQIVYSTVHALYAERYAFRDVMTDVVVQHLLTEQKVRIRCKDYVKKIAVYKDRLAVQLPERVLIYSLSGASEDSSDMQYRVTTRIGAKLECNLLVVTSQHVILCLEKKLQLYDLDGEKEREWVLEAVIRYIKVVGGPPGREGLLVGLKNGAIVQVLIDNPFLTQLITHRASIRCLDLSAERKKLAVVDESANVVVYDLATKGVLFEDSNANSVAWNGDMESMLCYSGNGQLSIRTGDFPVTVQKLQGFVVGFQASKVFCLHQLSMQTIDVPQSSSMHNYLTRGDIPAAYKVACLGVTDSDWRALAMAALTGMNLDIAKKALIRLRDVRLLDLLHSKQGGLKTGAVGTPEGSQLFLAEVLAYQGKFVEAARAFAKAGAAERAVALFTDLRQFELAKQWAQEMGTSASSLSPTSVVSNGVLRPEGPSSAKVAELIAAQAAWSEEVSDFRSAAEMYLQAGQPEAAIAILARHKFIDRLIEVMRGLSNQEGDRKPLAQCAAALARAGQRSAAKEAYLKLRDYNAVIALHLELEQWDEAVALLAHAPERRASVHGARARALAAQDRFEEARAAYKEAGLPEQSLRMLGQLAENAVTERRFKDAAHFLHAQSMEQLEGAHLQVASERALADARLRDFWAARRAAEVYYVYHAIHHSTDQPFRTVSPDALLHAGLFVLSRAQELPPGVSQVYVLQTLVKQGEALGAYKLARFAAERLGEMRLPSPTWQEEVDLAALAIRRQPMRDSENLLNPCARCGAPLPLFSAHFDRCAGCGHFVFRSFVTFEALPLLEFAPEEGVSQSEALELLEEEGPLEGPHMRGRQQHLPGDVQTLRLEEDEPPTSNGNGPSTLGMTAGELMRRQLEGAASDRSVVRADREMLRSMRRSDVLIWQWPSELVPVRYLCMVDPDLPVAICGGCNQLYEEEEWEMGLLEHATCPFCRGSGERPPAFAPRPPNEVTETSQTTNGLEAGPRLGAAKKQMVGSTGRPGTASARPGTGAGRPTSSWGKQGVGARPGSSAGRTKGLLSPNGAMVNGDVGGRKSSERSSNGGFAESTKARQSSARGRR